MTAEDFFKTEQIRTAHVPRLPGNNGDHLMVLGLEHLLKVHQVRTTSVIPKADWIVIRGNGAMNDFWRNALDLFTELVTTWPQIPIAVMPASYHFAKTDFAQILRDRKAPCYLFARERASYELLRSLALPPCVKVFLDHDMALCLEPTALVKAHRQTQNPAPNQYVLAVERVDVEHHSLGGPLYTDRRYRQESPRKELLKSLIRVPRRALIRARWRRLGLFGQEVLSPAFHEEVKSFLAEHVPAAAHLPIKSADVSDPLKYSFDEFCTLIAQASAVVTTRLHAGLFASMVGVPVAVRTGRYGKIAGVFEYSLSQQKDAWLLTGEREAGQSVPAAA